MRALRPALVGSLVIGLVFGLVAPAAQAEPVTDDAITWLLDQQEADGGFEIAGFPGFETPDAVLAIATHAQTGGTWSTAEARAAVAAADVGGVSALDWVDRWVEGTLANPSPPPTSVPRSAAGQRAKLILQVAAPLGLDPTDFDPANDDAPGQGVDLTVGLDTLSPAVFNSFLVGRLAEAVLGQNVHQRDIQVICEAAKLLGGGWSFDGLLGGSVPADLDTTGFATMALIAAGVASTDPVLAAAEQFVAGTQQQSGAWLSFGAADPNATTLALWAWLALGNDRDDLEEPDPLAWLRTRQAADGHIISPNDTFPPVNTFATTQTVQALHLGLPGADWLPRPAADAGRRCIAADTFIDVPFNAWFDDGARWVDDEGIVSGTNGALRPRSNVNRAQASTWLNLMFGGPGGDPHTFVDVPPGAWYEDGVNFVGDAPNGVIATGFGDEFRPRRILNRAQAASWLYAAAGAPAVAGLPANGFTDVGPGAWYRDAVTWAKARGIVAGFADNTFRGRGNVNRGQMAQWLFNLAATPEAWDTGATVAPTALFTPAP